MKSTAYVSSWFLSARLKKIPFLSATNTCNNNITSTVFLPSRPFTSSRTVRIFSKSFHTQKRNSFRTTNYCQPPFISPSMSFSSSATPSKDDLFRFDLNGFLIVPGVLTEQEVAAANAAIDRHSSDFQERKGALRNTVTGTPLAGDGRTGRKDLGACLGWPKGDREIFRSILTHPNLVPYLNKFLGHGYRLDHSPLIIAQDQGAEGFSLHGGPLNPDGRFNPTLQYRFVGNGDFFNSLLAVSVQLVDHNPGDGGFCVVKGTHKMNLPMPEDMMNGIKYTEDIYQPVTKAGDVVIFSEATVHGCLPWNKPNVQRRICLYRFAPANLCYGRTYYPTWPPEYTEGMTQEERTVMLPPYAPRLDRDVLDDNGKYVDNSNLRAAAKKDFDKQVFKTKYF